MIETTGNSQVFLGNGATTVFTFTFVGASTTYLSVVYTNSSGVQTDVTSSCTLALNAATGGALWGVGGTVTYNPSGTPIASGTTLTVTRTIPLTQLTAFANQNSVYNEVTEESFDTELMQLQQLNTTLLTSLVSTSTTSLTIGTGSQSLTVGTNKGFSPGQFVNIVYPTTPTDFMSGLITSYTASSGALVVYVLTASGSGTFVTWYVAVSGPATASPTITLTGDVTGSGTPSIVTTIAANAVTNAKFRQSAALSVVGVTGNATANVADIAAASDGQVLRRSGTAVSFGAVSLATATAITGTLGVTNGGTSSNLSATGGASQVLQQTSVGGAITVAQLAASNLSNGTTGSGAVVLATNGVLVTPALGTPSSGNASNLTNIPGANITANTVANTSLAQMAGLTLKGNATTATANASDVAAGSGVTPWGIPSNQNIIHNGDMYFDQRNEGASANIVTGTTMLDRWIGQFAVSTSGAGTPTSQQTNASSGLPINLTKSLTITANVTPSTSTPAGLQLNLQQAIEGTDVVDLGLGLAGASTVTVSFYAKSSLTSPTFAMSLRNTANNRSYPSTFTMGAANTWALYSKTLVLDTSGTWSTAIGTIGIKFNITLAGGSTFQGSNNTWQAGNILTTSSQTQMTDTGSSTFEITGLRLERGSTVTPFWVLPASDNLNKIRRFYRKTFQPGTAPAQNVGSVLGCVTVKNPIALGDPSEWVPFDPIMYTSPTIVTYNPSAGNANWRDITAGADVTVSVDPASTKGVNGVLIATSGTVTTLGDILAIHYTADSGI